ncbi:MAG: sugar ABC transporter ATP-binding protein [Clostridia bacterium]|nr:sugar ABC transporter ATP-binding protein [Clostridia bacterium]
MTEAPYLRMTGISKRFHGVQALQKVDFEAGLGQVTALVGENGAGKSTLMKILAGIHRRDEGEIWLGGREMRLESPLAAMHSGISVIHQELNVLPNLSIWENIFVGQTPKKGMFIDRNTCIRRTEELLGQVSLNVSPTTEARYLSTAQKQMVEILRAIAFDARIVVMDEPTSSLTRRETDVLFGIIRALKKRGIGIIYISHRMEEIMDLADRVVVLRDGRRVGALTREEMTEKKIISMMVGRELTEIFAKRPAPIGEVVLEARGLSLGFVRNVSFSVRAGEILGFSGLVGAGRSETMRMIFGIDRRDAGEIFMHGKPLNIRYPRDAIDAGIALVPEDRKEQALILGMDIRGNVSLAILRQLRDGMFVNDGRQDELTRKYVDELHVATPSIRQKVKNLSGGNQQKVVLAKWMAAKPEVLILDEPTRGIDVGAKQEIHSLMSDLAGRGVAIIMISSEMPEILGMSDRIVVMHEGRVKGELTRSEASQERIMQMAIGE